MKKKTFQKLIPISIQWFIKKSLYSRQLFPILLKIVYKLRVQCINNPKKKKYMEHWQISDPINQRNMFLFLEKSLIVQMRNEKTHFRFIPFL